MAVVVVAMVQIPEIYTLTGAIAKHIKQIDLLISRVLKSCLNFISWSCSVLYHKRFSRNV